MPAVSPSWIKRVSSHVGGAETAKKIGADAGISALFAIGGYLTSDDGPLKDASPETKRLVNAVFAAPMVGMLEVPALMETWKENKVPDFVMHGLTTAIATLGVASNDSELMSSAAMLATLFAMAGHLEAGIQGKSDEGIQALERTVPSSAKRMKMTEGGGHIIQDIDTADIAIDDLLVVEHGQTVPTDSVAHSIMVNNKVEKTGAIKMPLSRDGEGAHHPIDVQGKVPQGAITAEGTHLVVRATANAKESAILRNVEYLREAENSPSRMQHGVKNGISKIYVPIMLAACAAQFVMSFSHDQRKQERLRRRELMNHAANVTYSADSPPPVYFSDSPTGLTETGGAKIESAADLMRPQGKMHSLDVSLKRTAELAIKMAPCAIAASMLVLSFVKKGLAAEHNILVREDAALDNARKITHILTDIRGTLTTGKSNFQKFHMWDEAKGALVHCEEAMEATLLKNVGKAQGASSHPIAESFRGVAKERGIELEMLAGEKSELRAGLGAIGSFKDGHLAIGSKRLFNENQIEGAVRSVPAHILKAAEELGDVTYIRHVDAVGAEHWGVASFDDQLLEHARETIQQLRKSGKKIVLVTGMPEQSAKAILAKLETGDMPHNPIELRADLRDMTIGKELGKETVVAEFQRPNRVLAAIGDAGNDAPYMKMVKQQGGVSFAIGTMGAISTKDVASMVIQGVHQLPEIIDLSRRVTHAMWMNVGAAASWMSLLVGSHISGHHMKTQHASIAHEVPTLVLTLGGMAQSLHLIKSISSGPSL